MGVCPKTIAVETLDVLGHYQWPGNVRELQSALRQAILVGFGPVLRPDSLSPHVRGESQNPLREQVVGPVAGSPLPELNRYVRSRLDAGGTGLHAEVTALMERALLTEVLHHTGGNRTRAARILGVSQPTLRTRLAAADAYKAEGRSDVGRISPDVAG
jgi:two-component system nitrogen regulation response regulator GlnG